MYADPFRPLIEELIWDLKWQIALGKLPSGEKLPSVAVLSRAYQVNPEMVCKALQVLERERFIHSRWMAGRVVTKEIDQSRIFLGGVNVKFNQSIPIYLQLMKDLKLQIVSGQLQSGEKILSVRELALQYEVNPNTMQKALSELEREEWLFSQRTAGRFVTEDKELIAQLRMDLAKIQVDELVQNMLSMGYSQEEITQLIAGYLEEMN